MDNFIFGFYAIVNQNIDMWDIKIYHNDKIKDYRADIFTGVFGEDTTIQADSFIDCVRKIVNHINYHYNFINVVTFIKEASKIIPLQVDERNNIIKYLASFNPDSYYADTRNKGADYLLYYYNYLFYNETVKTAKIFNMIRNYLNNREYNLI